MLSFPQFCRCLLVFSFVATAFVIAQPEADPMAKITLLPTANDAYVLALEDLKTNVPEPLQQFTRYIWLADGDLEFGKTTSFTLNTISRATKIHRPDGVGVNNLQLVRVYLTKYAPQEADLSEYVLLWEELQFDPALNRLITKDIVNRLKFKEGKKPKTEKKKTKVKKKEKQSTKSKAKPKTVIVETETEIDEEKFITEEGKEIDLIRETSPHIAPDAVKEICDLTKSQAPLVTYHYFVRRVLSTIKDDGLFARLYGGLYYEFAGIKKSEDKDWTDEDRFFEDHLVIGNQKAKLTAKQVYAKIRSDQRVVMFRSDVTAKIRMVEFAHGLQGRDSQGSWSVTHDVRDRDIDINANAAMNLIQSKDFARELIYDRNNGMHGYALFAGTLADKPGSLQDEVPPDVANNSLIPNPHTKRLQAALGCIWCHEADGSDGWKPLRNDIKMFFKQFPSVLGDTTDAKRSLPDTKDRIEGLYDGSFKKWLSRSRDDYAEAVLKATGPWWKPGEPPDLIDKALKEVVKTSALKLVAGYEDHVYGLVDAQKACRELGVVVEKTEAVAVLNVLLPPDERAVIGANIPEDPRLAALKLGVSINRVDWDLTFSFAAERAAVAIAKIKEKQPQQKQDEPKKKVERKK